MATARTGSGGERGTHYNGERLKDYGLFKNAYNYPQRNTSSRNGEEECRQGTNADEEAQRWT